MCTSFDKYLIKYWVLLLSLVLVDLVAIYAEEHGAIPDSYLYSLKDNSDESTQETPATSTLPAPESTTRHKGRFPSPLDEISTAKMITLLLISFSIPLAFMLLLFWRLQREKKYLNARAGALVYRETVLVPSYTVQHSNTSGSDNNFSSNVIQMHSALYDTPPDYDEIVNSSSPRSDFVENGIETGKSKGNKTEELPPPSYSTVYM